MHQTGKNKKNITKEKKCRRISRRLNGECRMFLNQYRRRRSCSTNYSSESPIILHDKIVHR
jgi:hypothetical protein